MTDHPSTFKGPEMLPRGVEWDDRATLHRADGCSGLLEGATSLRSGTFAELVQHVMLMSEDERSEYYVAKLGDRAYNAAEVAALYARDDFPR